ncbi:TetR/AcrR family transcriptional regulator [Bacillus sp. SB49]|uniref:TetR/AcrR family transcriptional regulator n=1 Tax=Bacillus sp. SB49 TaxID=1071080 RepID=UPI000426209A|nr:TetR family transcriptional regulator [Bacillus sp. SB49]QHT47822.1 TetR/AcrR family transcriptional regulator [Bacillus sp. SB49]
MPKQTFFNLPEEKQEALMKAARAEFSRAPLHDSSISNIIKGCGVSRGSFYQYFEDKEDVFFYLLKQHSKERQALFISYLQQTEGNIFEAMTNLFHQTLDEFEEEENRLFFKHVFLNMNHKVQNTFTNGETRDRFLTYLNDIRQYIDESLLDVRNEEELYHAIHLVRVVMFNNMIRHFAKGLSKEKAMEQFAIELRLLKRGLSIRNEEE